jgi:hypothetical protein
MYRRCTVKIQMQQISLRLSDREKEHLDRYCQLTERGKGDVLRQLVRGLAIQGLLLSLDVPVAAPSGASSPAQEP